MKKSLIYVLIMILAVLIAYIMLGDFFSKDMQKSTKNPYAFDIKEFEHVDPALIKYKETKRIKLNNADPKAIDYHKGKLGLAFKNKLQLIDTSGGEIFSKIIGGPSTAIYISPDRIYLGCLDHIEIYDLEGNILDSWNQLDSGSYITSIALKDDKLYAANAGEPEVIKYNLNGDIEIRFDGTKQELSDFGFIIPSPYFDVHVDPDNQLWIANTGLQNIQNYTDEGALRAYWGNAGYKLEDFTGCCNPAHFTILTDGSFVTCEKGLVRIKVHKPSGELDGVVAAPKDFDTDSEPTDLTSDEYDNIYALDITKKMIRKFERIAE